MALMRMVNGVAVRLSPAEEAAQLAEWTANDPANATPSLVTSNYNAVRGLRVRALAKKGDLAAALKLKGEI